MGQYCPKCFSDNLFITTSSVIHIIINGMQMDSGRILYNPNKENQNFKEELINKIKNFFNWYQSLQNKTPIRSIKIFSSDYKCGNQCSLRSTNISVINDLISSKELMSVINAIKKDYNITLDIDSNDIY